MAAFKSTISRFSKRSQDEMLQRFLTFQITKSTSNLSQSSANSNPTTSSTSTSTSSSSATLPIPPSSTSSVHPKELQNQSNPFRPFRNPSTNKWWSAKISARREAQLIDLAFRAGTLDLITHESKKLGKLKSRLDAASNTITDSTATGGTSSSILPNLPLKDEVWVLNHHPSLLQLQESTSNPSSSSWISNETGIRKSKQVMEREAKLEQYRLLRRLISKKGPYKGRKSIKMFKGTKDERGREARWNGINEKLDEMDDKVKEWRMSKADAKSKAHAALPF